MSLCTEVQVSEGGGHFVCKFLAVHKDNDLSIRQLFKFYHKRRTLEVGKIGGP